MSEREWSGVQAGDESIHVGRIPDRKRLALYHVQGDEVRVLAYFLHEDDAEIAERMLHKIARVGAYDTDPQAGEGELGE